jgi:hypothetical protein
LVDAVEATGGDGAASAGATEADRTKLPKRNDPMLPRRQINH